MGPGARILMIGLALAPEAIAAQPFQLGTLPDSPNLPVQVSSFVYDSPSGVAQAAGVVTSASFAWSNFPCAGAAKISFLRYFPQGFFNIELLAERGPFDVHQALQSVSLSPPVTVLAGDFIAITPLTTCGTVLAKTPSDDELISPIGNQPPLPIANGTLALAASGTLLPDSGISGIIPVIYTGDGEFGAHFQTTASIHNPWDVPISGDFRYDFRFAIPYQYGYSLSPGETAEIVLTASFGSVEILLRSGPAPLATAYLFDDFGSSGTVGFTESDVSPDEALMAGDRGVLFGPQDPSNFRMNIGYRSVDVVASASATALHSDGTVAASITLTPGNLLTQVSFEDLFGIPLESNMTIHFDVLSGKLVAYAATSDNRTNDASLQIARRVASQK